MSDTPLLDWNAAESKAREGMARAVEHADRKIDAWSDKALKMLLDFAREVDGPFLIERARTFARHHGLPLPPDARAWGAVVRRASKHGLVRVGYEKARSSNMSPKCTWKLAP